MIIIKDLDFEMEQVKSTLFFNLKLPTIVNEGKENERIDMKINGYGMPFETCIQSIVSRRLSLTTKTYTVLQYVDAYVGEVQRLIDCVSYVYKAPKTDKEEEESDSEEIEEMEE